MTYAADIQAIILACWTSEDPLLRQLESDAAMLPLGEKAMLQRVLERLIGLGCRRIAVVHGDRPQAAEALLGDGERWGCDITHYYAAAESRPLRVLARLAPRGEDLCVLAAADTLALDSPDMESPCVACTRETGELRWSGWAVLSGDTLRDLAASVRDARELEARIMARCEASGRPPLITATISTASAAAALASLPRLFHLSPSPGGINRRPSLEDIWIGNGSRIHPSARLHAPVFIGNNVLVSAHAEIGPNAAIGDGCIIDAGSRIERSMVLSNSYVGRKLEVADALLGENQLLHARLGVALRVPEPGFLSDINAEEHGSHRVSLAQRALAVLLGLVLRPAAAILRCRRDEAAGRDHATIGIAAPRAASFLSVPVRFSMNHEEIHAGTQGAWTRHFLSTFVPGLKDVVAGKVALVGLQPRSAQEIDSLPYYWQRLYRHAPIGLLGEALLQGPEGAAAEMRYAGDALGAQPLPLSQVLRVLRRYAARVMPEILAQPPIRPASLPTV